MTTGLFSPEALERWLASAASTWRRPAKKEFIRFFEPWRQVFEPLFQSGRPTCRGAEAMDAVDDRLPAAAMIFCEPRYRYLPSGTAHPFFAFQVDDLTRIDRDLFNAHDVTVADLDLTFTGMYTHEVGVLADPTFWALT